MARPRHDPSAPSTPSRILAAARAQFSAHGFARARLADIARGAGIRRPSLLYHFPTKDDLYRAVVAEAFASLGAAMLPALTADGTVQARLESLVRHYVGFFDANPAVARIVVHELLGDEGPGQAILLEQVAPLLDRVQVFVDGTAALAEGVPSRAAILHVATNALLRAASGPLREPLWGAAATPDSAWAVARALLWRD